MVDYPVRVKVGHAVLDKIKFPSVVSYPSADVK